MLKSGEGITNAVNPASPFRGTGSGENELAVVRPLTTADGTLDKRAL